MTTGISEPQTPPTTAASKNVFQRIVGALISPGETFDDIARKPSALAPLIILILLGYATTIVIMPRMNWDAVTAKQEESMRKSNPNVSEADVARMTRISKSIGTVMGYLGPFLATIWWLILAGILLLAFRLMGGEGNYHQAFSTTLYAWIPLTIGSIIMTILIYTRGTFDPNAAATIVRSNPAYLVDQKGQPLLFSLLSNLDLFTIWTVILLIIGFASLSKTTKAKAASIVISLWIVQILIKLGLAAMSARMQA
jgi:hypothetical protein